MDTKHFEPSLCGVLLGQRYLIEQRIGQGGYGAVYRAEDTVFGRTVAVKVLHTSKTRDKRDVERFSNEAKIAARIDSELLVRVHDFGHDGCFYIVMEHLVGRSLREQLKSIRGAPLPWREAFSIGSQVCAALAVAHTHNVVHRDIKPENIFLVRSAEGEKVKVLDLGVAKILQEHGWTGLKKNLTSDQQIPGSLPYLAPERIQGARDCDGRVDIYSLGVVLYEMLTGEVPFRRDEEVQVMYAHVHVPPLAPRLKNPELPPALEGVVLRALAKNPAERYASATEMSAAIQRALTTAAWTQAGEIAHSPARPPEPRQEAPVSANTGTLPTQPLSVDSSNATPQWRRFEPLSPPPAGPTTSPRATSRWTAPQRATSSRAAPSRATPPRATPPQVADGGQRDLALPAPGALEQEEEDFRPLRDTTKAGLAFLTLLSLVCTCAAGSAVTVVLVPKPPPPSDPSNFIQPTLPVWTGGTSTGAKDPPAQGGGSFKPVLPPPVVLPETPPEDRPATPPEDRPATPLEDRWETSPEDRPETPPESTKPPDGLPKPGEPSIEPPTPPEPKPQPKKMSSVAQAAAKKIKKQCRYSMFEAAEKATYDVVFRVDTGTGKVQGVDPGGTKLLFPQERCVEKLARELVPSFEGVVDLVAEYRHSYPVTREPQ